VSEAGDIAGGLPPPMSNPELLGHEEAETRVLDAWYAGRMPHAWLIAGPRGIGKATLAYRIAKFVLSGGKTTGEAGLFGADDAPPTSLATDPTHRVARLVASEGHRDLHILRRQLNDRGVLSQVVRVDDVRAFEAGMRLHSAEGGWRVAIVDEAERMNRNAENALLKILEEPPPNTLILIVSNAESAMLATTRSRCRRLPLSPLPDTVVSTLLARARPDLTHADTMVILRLADGSIGSAIALADAGGAKLYRMVVAVLGTLPEIDGEALHAMAGAWARKPKEGELDPFATGTALMRRWIDQSIRAASAAPGLTEITPGDLEAGRAWVARIGVEAAFRRRAAVERLIRLEQVVNLERKQVILDSVHTLAYGEDIGRGGV